MLYEGREEMKNCTFEERLPKPNTASSEDFFLEAFLRGLAENEILRREI